MSGLLTRFVHSKKHVWIALTIMLVIVSLAGGIMHLSRSQEETENTKVIYQSEDSMFPKEPLASLVKSEDRKLCVLSSETLEGIVDQKISEPDVAVSKPGAKITTTVCSYRSASEGQSIRSVDIMKVEFADAALAAKHFDRQSSSNSEAISNLGDRSTINIGSSQIVVQKNNTVYTISISKLDSKADKIDAYLRAAAQSIDM